MAYTSLNDLCKKYNIEYNVKFEYLKDYILQLFNENIIIEETLDSNILLWNGIYYETIEDDKKMIYFYEKAYILNNSAAMVNLGVYYQNKDIDYIKMKYYYKMAIRLKNSNAMCNLGFYYMNIECNCKKMVKYYKMSIKLLNNQAMYNLGHYYEHDEGDYDKMLYYYLMAVENNYPIYILDDLNMIDKYNLLLSSNNKNKIINDDIDKLKIILKII